MATMSSFPASVAAMVPANTSKIRRVNFSMREAAAILGYELNQMSWLIRNDRIRVYQISPGCEPRTTILELYEYSMLSGRCLCLRGW